ncbi:MAG: hypothetical protein M3025_03635 [Actinomycetota bacterium]|nr:hypothetical protein [Actinomycetota bacterium]
MSDYFVSDEEMRDGVLQKLNAARKYCDLARKPHTMVDQGIVSPRRGAATGASRRRPPSHYAQPR